MSAHRWPWSSPPDCSRSPLAPAQAQKVVSIGGAKRTAMVAVNIGKTEDVRTDTSFVDLQVGDPEVADVNPLTDKSLSILGRKSGTTRVTAYGENKKLIGVFDVEVSHDTSMLASTLVEALSLRQAQGRVRERPHHAVGNVRRTPSRSTRP